MFLRTQIDVVGIQLVFELTLEVVEKAIPAHEATLAATVRSAADLSTGEKFILYKSASDLLECHARDLPPEQGVTRRG
jgi:hypothetical protein